MTKKIRSLKFLHLVDHDGAIFDLISQLSIFRDHKILTSFSKPFKNIMKQIDKISSINKEIIVIIHATGSPKRFYKNKEKIIKKFKKGFLFLHVSPKHFLIKNRLKELVYIKKLSKKYNTKILIPSKSLKKKFLSYGIGSIPIQVGLDFKIDKKGDSKKYNNEIITVCTSKDKKYQYIKGIDLFTKLIKRLGIENKSIILGDKLDNFDKIKNRKVSKKYFLKHLNNSKVYIQLSRTESYNSSAIYAKRMRVPVIVSDIEGHKNNVKNGFRVSNIKEAEKILKKILRNSNAPFIKEIIKKNYEDSIKRESLRNFRNSLNNLLNQKI